ncbi:hypothetical protein [Varunaivibrio sulfuroxidans]|uniref:Flagellar hook-length control protein FliK n=1 Tax=Varunaivibrio sulfuroxidans TaxID=1773489 RepID=A0A4R3JCJ0_9PROT|nr:hypothetical protein [Varunaivibrio sulfuroxidans]TCS63472.1 hypothetical protein EDD55_10393 [Varunaivibrio sulfuroxidans]WES30382.1 hypothetical protein P3M64_12180 [Varunaivibrio sulfuroxidans]
MTSIVPPPAAPPPRAVPPTGFKARLDAPDAILSRLAVAQKIDAVIVDRLPQGRALIQTPVGQMIVRSAAPFPSSGNLSLVVTRLGAPVGARITQISGEAVSPGAAPKLPGGAPASSHQIATQDQNHSSLQGSAKSAAVAPVTLSIGMKVTATLLKAHPFTPDPGQGAHASSEKNAASPPVGTRGGSPDLSLTQKDATTAQRGGARRLQMLPIGTRFGATIRALTPPSPHLSAHIQAPPGQVASPPQTSTGAGAGAGASGRAIALNIAPGRTLNAVVTNHTPQGQPIVQSQGAVMVLDTAATLSRGSTLSLTISSAPMFPKPSPGLHAQGAQGATSPTPLGQSWDVLDDVLSSLNRIDAEAARAFIHGALPRADKHFSATVLFFLSALRGGDIGLWLGDKTTALLKRTRPGALDKLNDVFKDNAHGAARPGPADWRAMAIPFFNGQQIEAIHLYMRRHAQEEDDDDAHRGGVRFVFDLMLSRLGRLQFDGLVRPHENRLDVIVRSESPLPDAIKAEMSEIFAQSGALERLNGALGFQSDPPHFVNKEETKPSPSGPSGEIWA